MKICSICVICVQISTIHRLQAHCHRVLVSVEHFGGGHCLNRRADMSDSVGCKLLKRNLFHKAVDIHATVGAGIAVGGQRMVGARSVVARKNSIKILSSTTIKR